jgi:hypothetical protein
LWLEDWEKAALLAFSLPRVQEFLPFAIRDLRRE